MAWSAPGAEQDVTPKEVVMDSRRDSLRRLAPLVVAGILSVAWAAMAAAGDSCTDPRQRMVATLSAAGPHRSLGDQARVWDRFIGTWDADFGFIGDDGSVRHAPGEIDFGWVLDGRAVQDLWIGYPRDGAQERSIGTSLRYFDEKAKLWNVVFVNPQFDGVLHVRGGPEGDRIVLRGQDAEGAALRWSFADLQPDSFTWRGERSRDGGKSWRLQEEHHMRRRAGEAKAAGDERAPEPSRSELALQNLASLVGAWQGLESGTEIHVTYTLTANGSALMEEFRPTGGPAMVTMFTVDGDHLVATHYCSARNQPQMTSPPIVDPRAKSVAFSLARVTGLKTPDDWHNTGLVLTVESPDQLTQEWTYAFKGDTGKNRFHLARARPVGSSQTSRQERR